VCCKISKISFFLDNQLRDGDKDVSLTKLAELKPTKIFLVLISVRSLVEPRAIVRLEGLSKLKKKSMTSSGIEPATSRLVA
jgi:hypothetical protein